MPLPDLETCNCSFLLSRMQANVPGQRIPSSQQEPQLLQSTEGQSQCARHQQELKLFCELDQMPLCMRCSQSPEHGAHRLSPVGEAADNYREKLQCIRSDLGKHLEEAEKRLAEHRRSAAGWHWMVLTEYYKLGYFLMHEEHLCYERIEEDERARYTRLSQYKQTLQHLLLELQEAGHQPNEDLLQEGKQLLGRSESVLSQRTKAVTPELREYPIPGIMEMLNSFRVDIMLDPTSASPCVTVSEDLRSVQAGEGWPGETWHPADLAGWYVFAEQAFRSGTLYWEVDVTQLPQWILGIHSPCSGKRRGRRDRKDRKVNSCLSVFLLLCVKKEEDCYFQTYPGSLNHQVKGPVPRVGVCLDYSFATLTFYNILRHCLIYSFHLTSITQPITAIFSPGPPLPGTKGLLGNKELPDEDDASATVAAAAAATAAMRRRMNMMPGYH
ncbi:E3 ubiquitin-protein ligase TRIM21-like [Phascolarctos cinereus]|uniref:E3 ubiquitin-protein ligase TRIM21-like n=1 Tax=Phascolarctos cinereus TaxID=38626 RepID=A0A6P5KZN2_PHACI|nr:E3 ubiquitin-protein ligase TRIM21-like [Phascolarctos cinereus]